MVITIISSREFNQDSSGAKKASIEGPVFITDRGRPAHVLLSIDDYRRLAGSPVSIIHMLAAPEVEAVEFEPVRAVELYKAAKLR